MPEPLSRGTPPAVRRANHNAICLGAVIKGALAAIQAIDEDTHPDVVQRIHEGLTGLLDAADHMAKRLAKELDCMNAPEVGQ